MYFSIKRLIRWIRFQVPIKQKYGKTPGIPSLCSNINHDFHESLWEKKTCELLCKNLNKKDVKNPTQHKYPIRFDFIVKNVAIFEPHAIYGSNPENSS